MAATTATAVVVEPLPHPALRNQISRVPYLPGLDGLRAIAVSAVLVYHANHTWLTGGFLGVEVFFVISGYLITLLLLSEKERTGTVRLGQFWLRRARRLLPALFVMMASLAIYMALFNTRPMGQARGDLLAGSFYVSNWFQIWVGQSYTAAENFAPLRHLWSLAVEEQFYILLALLMVAVVRVRRPHRVLAVVAALGIVVPVALSNMVTDWQPSLEFNTFLRMPELFAGVLLAVWHRSRHRVGLGSTAGDALAGVGVAVLVGLFLLADYTPPWLLRGGYSLVAMVTAFTVAGLLQHGRVAAALAVRPLRWLGTISYSLYLVHWPAMSVLTRERTHRDGVALLAVLLTVSVLTAWVLHRVIERPIRQLRTAPLPTLSAGFAAAAVLTVVALVAL